MNRIERAFTLIELVIVLAIVAILTAVAYPTYRSYITKTHRVQAAVALVNLAASMERYYSEHHSYQHASLIALRFKSGSDFYRVKISSANDDGFTIKATPIKAQAKTDIKCGTLSLDQLGNRSISGNGSVRECW